MILYALVILIFVSLSLQDQDKIEWVKTSGVDVDLLRYVSAPDAYDAVCSDCPLKKGYLVRVKMEDTSHVPATWIPNATRLITTAWDQTQFNCDSFDRCKSEYLYRSRASISWEFAFKDNVPIEHMVLVGTLADNSRVYACRAFQGKKSDRLIIGRFLENHHDSSAGCIIHVNGKEETMEYHEVAVINMVGASFQMNRVIYANSEDFCDRNLCES